MNSTEKKDTTAVAFNRESDQADAKLLREHRLRMDEEERKRAENLQVTSVPCHIDF